jgi:predicted DNA-binding protein (MmcQ/YjbR family)
VAGEALERLRQFGLRYPGAHTKSPWPGHLDLAVNDKTFAYISVAGEPPKISCKLQRSAEAALSLPFTTPTEYGLGKSGWVTATFPDGASLPEEMLQQWIDESYRAQAPKRLSKALPPLADVEVSASQPAGRAKASARARSAVAPVSSKPRSAKKAKGSAKAVAPAAKKAASATKRATVTARSAKKAGKRRARA